jgi:hypothetical protein
METQHIDRHAICLINHIIYRIHRIFLTAGSDMILIRVSVFSFLTKIIRIPLELLNYLIIFCAIDIETTYTNQVIPFCFNIFFCADHWWGGGGLFVRIKP